MKKPFLVLEIWPNYNNIKEKKLLPYLLSSRWRHILFQKVGNPVYIL